MGVGDFGTVAFEVGDGLGDFDDFEIGAGGEIEFLGGGGKEGFGGLGEVEEGGDFVGGEGTIIEVGFMIAGVLAGGRLCYFIFYNIMFVGGRVGGAEEIAIVHLLDEDIHVDAVEEGTGELFLVVLDLGHGTGAFVGGVASVATGAGVHGGDEHKIGWIGGLLAGATDGNPLIFERLAECFENRTGELGDFVEEEDSMVGERNLAWGDASAAANDRDGGSGMVGRTEGAGGDNVVGEVGDGVNFRDGDLFLGGKGREKVGSGASEQGFAGTRRAGNEDIVVAGDGNFHGTFGEVLTANMVEQGAGYLCFGFFYNICGGQDRTLVFQMEEELSEVIDRKKLHIANERGLGEVLVRKIDFRVSRLFGGLYDVDNAADGAKFAVERELADKETVIDVFLEKLARGDEDREGNREIKKRAVLG